MSLDEVRNLYLQFFWVKFFFFQRFNSTAEKVKSLSKRPTDDELLELYALFKQGTVGDNNTSKEVINIKDKDKKNNWQKIGKPGLLDLKGKAKWNAWNNKKDLSQNKAKEEYISYAESLLRKYKWIKKLYIFIICSHKCG